MRLALIGGSLMAGTQGTIVRGPRDSGATLRPVNPQVASGNRVPSTMRWTERGAMTEPTPSLKDMLEHAWRYFALHATQRISLFNFFVVISASLSAGLATCLQKGGVFQLVGAGLGGLLALISFLFWKLDQRTAFLIKHAERAITDLEADLPSRSAHLLSKEPEVSADRTKGFWIRRMWTYGAAFRLMFLVMGTVGTIGAALALARYRGCF